MNRLLTGLIIAGLLYIAATFLLSPSPDDPGFTETVTELPVNTSVKQTAPQQAKSFKIDEYRITPLADVEIAARVLSTERYWLGREAELSPLDLALGWGRMADSDVLERIDISQSSRWYYWKADRFPIPRKEIESSSANMHMIPANDSIADFLKSVEKDQRLFIKGNLVRVDADDGWRWVSSLSRNDTGNRACELVYVTAVYNLQ